MWERVVHPSLAFGIVILLAAPAFTLNPPSVAIDEPTHLRLADGSTLRANIPYDVALVREGGTERSRLLLPAEAAAFIDDRLLDVATLAEQGKVDEDGGVRVIVRIRAPPGATPAPLRDAMTFSAFPLVAGRTTLAELPALALTPGVERVWLADDARIALVAPTGGPTTATSAPRVAVPGTTGAGVTIAIIDTGIDHTHPDLGGCFGVGCKVAGGWDFVEEDGAPMDDHGHGTHVASIAAGLAAGMAPDATLLAYKVCTAGGWCTYDDVLAGIDRAIADGADIISMSLGGPGTSDGPLAWAVDAATSSGVVVVSAAGNSGPSDETVGEPAAARRGIAVGAVDRNDELAYFSSRGPVRDGTGAFSGIKPDILALGVDVLAAVPTGGCALCDPSGWRPLSGTSMSTPQVSGAAALLLEAHPAWKPELVKAALVSGAEPLGFNAREEGAGRLDVEGAFAARLGLTDGVAFFGVSPSGREEYGDTMPFALVNLGSTPLHVRASGGAFGFTIVDEGWSQPLAMPIPPETALQLDLRIHVQNALLPDGWHESAVRLRASPVLPEETHALAELQPSFDVDVKATFLKSGVLTLTSSPSAWITMLEARDPTSWERSFGGHGAIRYMPAGVYDALALWSHGYTNGFVDGFVHDGESNLTIVRPDSSPAVPILLRFADGSNVAPASLPQCPYVPSVAERCRNTGGLQLLLANGSAGYAVWSSGSVTSATFGPSTNDWRFGAFNTYREPGISYFGRVAVTLPEMPAALAPEPIFSDHAIRWDVHGEPPSAVRLAFCTSGGFAYGAQSVRFTDGLREAFLVAGGDFPLVPTNWGLLHPTNCRYVVYDVYAGPFAADLTCPPGSCYLSGIAHAVEPSVSGARLLDAPWRNGAYDLRHATREGDFVLADGAPYFVGTIRIPSWSGGRQVQIFDPTYYGMIMPASGGLMSLPAFAREGSTFYRVEANGAILAEGPLDWHKQAYIPQDGSRVRVTVGAQGGGWTGNMTYFQEFDAHGVPDEWARIEWARVTDAKGIAMRFAEGAALTLHVKASDPDGAPLPLDIVVRQAGGAQWRVEGALVGPDGLVHVELPALGKGVFGLDITARAADGSVAELSQARAYVVE